uniref:hypothetical protein n=1 Tax=Gluconobacter thailandicus TaxID=257438 RepID=UPI000777DA71|nr:hypothetical protein [Gluconobacter thailandicus]
MPEIDNNAYDAQKDLQDLLEFSARYLFSFNVIENNLFQINMRILQNWQMASALLQDSKGVDARIRLTTNLIKTGRHARNYSAWSEVLKHLNKSKEIRNIIAHSYQAATVVNGQSCLILSQINNSYKTTINTITSIYEYDNIGSNTSKKDFNYTANFVRESLPRVLETQNLVSKFFFLTDITEKQYCGSDTAERRDYYWEADKKRKEIMFLATGDEDPDHTKRMNEFDQKMRQAVQNAQTRKN